MNFFLPLVCSFLTVSAPSVCRVGLCICYCILSYNYFKLEKNVLNSEPCLEFFKGDFCNIYIKMVSELPFVGFTGLTFYF